jgi:hypothetical protein
MRPWNSARASSEVAHATLQSVSAAPTSDIGMNVNAANHPAAPPAEPAAAGTDNPDFTSVLDKIEQVRAIDPAAEQTLLAELHKAPPNSWPLVAEQFRASLAYREELRNMAKQTPDTQTRDTQTPPASMPVKPESARPVAETTLPLGTPMPQQEQQSGIADSLSAASHNTVPPSTAWPSTSDQPEAAAKGPEPAASVQNAQAGSSAVIQASLHSTAADESAKPDASERTDENPSAAETNATHADWQRLVNAAEDDLSRVAPASPTTTAEVHQHVSLRILRLLAGDTEGALEPIPRLSSAEQDYWSKQLFALATYLDHHRQPDEKRRAAASVIHLDEAVSHLRELGALSVRNLSFCKAVYGYGATEPYDADRFSAGQQVSLYVEVENYHSKSTEKGYCTSLGSTYEILNEAGDRVGGGEIPDVNDCCRSRRRDFHIQYALSLPQNLAPGRYQLQLVIKDRQSDKRGHATVAFEIKGAITPSQTALPGS